MRYQDKKYYFSFEIPEGWSSESWLIKLLKGQSSVRVSIYPESTDANINVTCMGITPDIEDPDKRNRALLRYMVQMGFKVTESGSINDILAGEDNVVHLRYRAPIQKEGRLMDKTSAVHKWNRICNNICRRS